MLTTDKINLLYMYMYTVYLYSMFYNIIAYELDKPQPSIILEYKIYYNIT